MSSKKQITKSDLLNALRGLYESFQHTPGNDRGNKAKTDIIKFNQHDIAPSLNIAGQILWKAEGRTRA